MSKTQIALHSPSRFLMPPQKATHNLFTAWQIAARLERFMAKAGRLAAFFGA
jgi:hypothetical protein